MPDVVVDTSNPSTQGVEAGKVSVLCQPGINSEILAKTEEIKEATLG